MHLYVRMPHAQVEALEEALRHERRSAADKDARNKLNVDRLRRQIAEMQARMVAHSPVCMLIYRSASFNLLYAPGVCCTTVIISTVCISANSAARPYDSLVWG